MMMTFARAAILSIIISLTAMQSVSAAKSPKGLWVATSPFFYDRPIAIVKIYLNNNIVYGELVKIIPLNERIKGGRIANSGPLMMYGYHEEKGDWIDGTIYEQITARVYKSSFKMSADGDHLFVRGMKGPFFRTAQWDRLK